MNKYLWLAMLILTTSCETVLTMQEIDPNTAIDTNGRILFGISSDSKDQKGMSCDLVFKADGSSTYLQAAVGEDDHPKAFKVPAGKYHFDRIRCSGKRQFYISSILPYSFTVLPEKTSLVGHLYVKFDNERDQVFLRLTDGRKSMNKGFQDAVKRSRGSVISGYTEKSVTPSMYALGGEASWNMQMLYDPKSVAKNSKPNPPSLDPIFECEKTEFEWNPLRLGTLQFEFDFNNGRYVGLNQTDSVHLFSDAFVNCLKNSAKLFRVETPGKSKLQLSFR